MKNEDIVAVGDKLAELIELTSRFDGFIVPRDLAIDLLQVVRLAEDLNENQAAPQQPGKHLIGMAVTPRLQSHLLFGLIGIVRGVGHLPREAIGGKALCLQIWIPGMPGDRRLGEPGDDWKTA